MDLRDLWIAHLPDIDLDARFPEPTLFDLNLIHPPVNASGLAEIDYVSGTREAIFREAIILSRKFAYCAALLTPLSDIGKSAWTTVVAYEAAFYGAKAFCYFLGFASIGRSSNHYVDAFYETIRTVKKKKLVTHDTLMIHKLDDRLTHRVLWGLTERLINTTSFPENLQSIQTDLKIVDWGEFMSFRNSMLYDGGFWPYRESFGECDLTKPIHLPELREAAFLDNDLASAPFAPHYFKTALLLRRLVVGMLASIQELAPGIEPEVKALKPMIRQIDISA